MTYAEIIKDIESRSVMPAAAPSLGPMQKALALLLPESTLNSAELSRKTIIVAGTNGKGSVCATLERLLLDAGEAGESVGLYTSPHLEETTERIRINGQDIDRELFCLAYEKVIEATGSLSLSHFEILTLMAAWVFYSGENSHPVRWAILEVGLGGTWDATNAIPHDTCIITTLGFDHQNLLGNTIEEIALNKFGIIGTSNRVIHSPFPADYASSLKNLATLTQVQTQSHWTESASFKLEVHRDKSENPSFILNTQWGSAPLSLPGKRAAQNACTALTAFEALGYNPQDFLSALGKVRWPGRMEKVKAFGDSPAPCPLYLSGDHNPAGVQSLIEVLSYYRRNHLYLLIGIGKDKDCEEMLSLFSSIPHSSIYLTETPFRGRKISDYGHWLSRVADAFSDPLTALNEIFSKAQSEDLIVVSGSLYLVGEIRKRMIFTYRNH